MATQRQYRKRFIGIGAYTAAILAGRLGLGFWLALPFSALFSAIIAGLIGLPSLRVSGQHYIIITFCFCSLLNIALTNGGSFTGGATGLDVGSIDRIFGINFDQLRNTYYLVIVVLLLCLLGTYLIVNSSYGRTLRAIRENEPLARAVGINANRHKIGVLMASGVFAALAGILQAYYLRQMESNFRVLATKRDAKGGELSGGQQQMLAIARGLMARPRVLLLDEPSLGLSPLLIKELRSVILDVRTKFSATVLLVEQNAGLALAVAERLSVATRPGRRLRPHCGTAGQPPDARTLPGTS